MKAYTYQILRYLPDRISGEFVNVGLVLYCEEERYIRCSVLRKIGRVKHLFPEVHSKSLISKIKLISGRINKIGFDWENQFDFGESTSLQEITRSILPVDDSALFFTKEKSGIDLDIDIAFTSMYDRFITQNEPKSESYATDQKVWRNIYKSYFEKYNLDDNLIKRAVKTDGDVISFDHAVKNGKWNYLEPITFCLRKDDKIKNKVYSWMGKLQELDKSEEEFSLFLLSEMPSDDNIRAFIHERISSSKHDNFTVEIIEPERADDFVRNLSEAVHNH